MSCLLLFVSSRGTIIGSLSLFWAFEESGNGLLGHAKMQSLVDKMLSTTACRPQTQ